MASASPVRQDRRQRRHAHPLFQKLKQDAPGILGTEGIKWNFTKFLIRKDGTVYNRYAPATKPEELIADIEKLLANNGPAGKNTSPWLRMGMYSRLFMPIFASLRWWSACATT
jgi:hypothetical protein